jgi:cell division protein FtsI (penicillin-binding protein 3)
MLSNHFTLATLSFGYGMAVTNLQLAKAYSVLANGGVKEPITLLKRSDKPKGKRVLSKKISQEIVTMLETVVSKEGTAVRAQVPGYRVSGKTGTVRMVGKDGYEINHHSALFVGMAPVSHPRLVVSVIIKDPKRGGFYGGLVAAPVFSKVMGGALRILDIPPDKHE